MFHEGFGKRRKDRAPDLERLLGNIPYLNGGLFDVHELEKPERYGMDIQIPDKAFERVFDYFDQYQWHLDERPLRADNEINPDVLGYIFEKYINQKQMGAYYTKEDITEYISKNTVLPFLFDDARAKCRVAFENPHGPTVWDLLRENPDRYIYHAARHGTDKKLPTDTAVGLDTSKPDLIARRQAWNKPAPADYALPTEIWREVISRRQRYEEIRQKLVDGEVREINDFITLNLDLLQFAQDVILYSEGPDLLRAVWHAIQKVTVLDPTCGSGAFLFAALNILEPLYDICLDRMEAFVVDDDRARPKLPEDSVRELIASGESLAVEFKSTARWNVKESKPDKVMEQVIIKTVAAFLNSAGGDLLIGVQDDGSIFGIEADQQIFSTDKRNRDTYENWLMTQLLRAYGKQYASNLRISFVRLGEKDVCRVAVTPASSAVYVKENNQDTLYVRTGNSTRSLTTSEAIAYHQHRFTQFTTPPKFVEHSKPSSPKKYADFRKVLEAVSAHPKRSYFIFKSIILNNLFGVDIMEEAVEICKLRLFLKLAAQVEPDTTRDNFGIEPLPDIDFNIRAGNTLVGYVSEAEVRRCMKEFGGGQMKLLGEDELNSFSHFNTRCADVEQAFTKFRQLQTEGDGSVPAADKLELQKRLKALEDELNRHLAGEYGVKVSDKVAYAKWVKSHLPFHWFIQFYGILARGGFDVIIGNPPYVEYRKVMSVYTARHYKTEVCGNLYGLVMERNSVLVTRHGRTGMIVPHSAICTDRMESVQALFTKIHSKAWCSTYCIRPSKLFVGVDQRLAIYVAQHNVQMPTLFSSRYHKWHEEFRPHLFHSIQYADISAVLYPNSWTKINTSIEIKLCEKLGHFTPLGMTLSQRSGHKIYYHNAPRYWNRAMTFAPYFWNERDGEQVSSHVKILYASTKLDCSVIVAVMNSSIFYWWFIALSNCRDLGKREIETFPVGMANMANSEKQRLSKMVGNLMTDLKKHKLRKECQYKTTGRVVYDEFYPRHSKSILNEIDTVLAGHYGFTAEELDFILNFDFKFRLGRSTESKKA